MSFGYDSRSRMTSRTDSEGTLADKNPLRYRGYYYDSESGLYYLQSRYYDPNTGRFINADAYASTGQGVLGHNMFQYCGNNPLIRVDKDGQRYSSAEIHNLVLDDICQKHPTMTRRKTYMKYKGKNLRHTYGYCDLYDQKTGEVWEAKRFMGGASCSKTVAQRQLKNYVENGVLVYEPELTLHTGGTYTAIEPNVFEIMDKDMEGAYVISYWDAGDGIIFYDYVYEPSLKEVGYATVGGLLLAAYLGLAFCTGGASLGVPLPA